MLYQAWKKPCQAVETTNEQVYLQPTLNKEGGGASLTIFVTDCRFWQRIYTGHILDLYCVRLSKAVPFCKNYTKLYFDGKHLEKEFNRGEIFGVLFSKKSALFHKKVLFLANIERCPKFLEYALLYIASTCQ